MEFLRVVLQAPADHFDDLLESYARKLGMDQTRDDTLRVGVAELSFRKNEGNPFYHFAFLVPGDRFDAARDWISTRVSLLEGGDIDDVVFDFDNWSARAVYFHDPAGNIVELVAHEGIDENGRTGEFDASELVGLSEVALVGEQSELARGLGELGVQLWDGAIAPGGLAFLGERARTFIAAPPGRGWLPTGRPAEVHAVEATISGPRQAAATLGPHRINSLAVA